MIRYFRELRLIPIAIVASTCLLALVAADLLLGRNTAANSDSGATGIADATVIHAGSSSARPSDPKQSWAQQMFNFPNSKGAPPERTDLAFLPAIAPLASDRNNADIITGSVTAPSAEKSEKPKGEGNAAAGKEAANKDAPAKEPKEPPPSPNGAVISMNAAPAPSAAERAILERLQERRQELEKRARELDIREGLIAEAEKRVDSKLAEIKEGQAQLAIAVQKKDEAEAARFKGLVTMYETMKPRRRQDFRSARSRRSSPGGLADQPAQHVGNSGADVAGPGRAFDRGAGEPRPSLAEERRRRPAENRRPTGRTVTSAN
jgi:flagellar motility protein MotE (MotC chaperone)